MTDLKLATIQEIVEELMNRCTASVVALQYRQEGYVEDRDYETHTNMEGDFVHCAGLVSIITTRMEEWKRSEMFGGDDEDDA